VAHVARDVEVRTVRTSIAEAQDPGAGAALGVLTLTPYHHWRRNHLHHTMSSDLNRRGLRSTSLSEVAGHHHLGVPGAQIGGLPGLS